MPIIVIILSFGILVSFVNAKYNEQMRDEYILDQVQEQSRTIEVFDFPQEYIFDDNDSAMLGCKYYYNEPYDITFITIGYDEWVESNRPDLVVIK